MKKLIVNFENYRYSEYPAYFNRGTEIEKPQNPAFEMGEVVVITSEDGLEIGVVIGWIDESYWELRTDMAGMVSMDAIRSATLEDFSISNIHFLPRLLEECLQLKP
jgi:hypothetical protein